MMTNAIRSQGEAGGRVADKQKKQGTTGENAKKKKKTLNVATVNDKPQATSQVNKTSSAPCGKTQTKIHT